MMRGRVRSRLSKALWVALAVHSLMALVLLWTPSPPTPAPEPVPLELVSLPPEPQPPIAQKSQKQQPKDTQQERTPEPTEPPPAQEPAIKPLKVPEIEIEALPDIVLPSKPKKMQAPLLNKPIAPAQPKTAAPPKPAQRMTYEDFLKKRKAQPTPKDPAPKTNLKLDPLKLPTTRPTEKKAPQTPSTPVTTPSPQHLEPSAQALAQLRAHIDSVWQKPPLSEARKTRVSFSVAASGRLENIHLDAPSGQKNFDQSITDALNRVQLPNVRPELLGQRFSMTFESHL